MNQLSTAVVSCALAVMLGCGGEERPAEHQGTVLQQGDSITLVRLGTSLNEAYGRHDTAAMLRISYAMLSNPYARRTQRQFNEVLRVRGMIMSGEDHRDIHRLELDSMRAAAEAAQDTMIWFATLVELGTLSMDRDRDLATSLSYLEEALKLDPDKTLLENDPILYLRLADSHDQVKQPRSTIRYATELVALGQRTGNAFAQYWGHIYLASAHQQLGVTDTAAFHVDRSIALLQGSPPHPFHVSAYSILAGIERQHGNVERAGALLDSVDILVQRFGQPLAHYPHAVMEKAWHALGKGDTRGAAAMAGILLDGPVHQRNRFVEQCYHQVMDSVCLAMGDHQGAYQHHTQYEDIREQMDLTNAAARLRSIESNYREEAQRAQRRLEEEAAAFELQRERTRRNVLLAAGLASIIFGAISYWQRRRTKQALHRSDELLLNILPEEVADELKLKGHADAKHFDNATILFTDFKGFTQLSEKVTPAELIAELNTCFKEFDGIMGKYRIEKIKTIGDAYMAAGGLPDPKHGSPADVVRAALEMQEFMQRHKAEREAAGKPYFEMRVGIHTGPVVAGIVGVKKFQYDIWGDTVNTASRMESSGEVGQVNISEATYVLVKNAFIGEDGVASTHRVDRNNASDGADQHATRPAFTFTPRGKIQAKGKGEMEMYFVERRVA